MGLFSFIDDLLDSTEEVITETPKTVKEKAPELAAFVGNTSLTAGYKALEYIGREAAKRPGGEALGEKCAEFAEYIKHRRENKE